MRKLFPILTALMAVSLLLFVSACSKNQTGSNVRQTNMTNSEAEKAIKDKFDADPQLSASNIKVSADTKNNGIKLSGTVNSEDARDKAIHIAQSALPGFTVSDTIDVKPREMAGANTMQSQQSTMSDSDAEKAVKDKFITDPQLNDSNIKVSADTKKNEIKLSGTVDSEGVRDKAIQIAQSALPGFGVNDTIDVKPKQMARTNYDDQQVNHERQAAQSRGDHIGDSAEDAQIHSRIMRKLSGSNWIQDVRVDVDKGVVTLHGKVPSGNEKAEAERAAQSIQGVKRVYNKLDISSNQ